MALQDTTKDQRKNRYTIYLNDEEKEQIVNTALDLDYSNKAIGRFIREHLLSSIADGNIPPSISVPAVSEQAANDLRGAVNNLNQSVKTLNRVALSSPPSAQLDEAKLMMKNVYKVAHVCADYKKFLDGDIENKKLLYTLAFHNFDSSDLENLARAKREKESK
jgi:type II secretory pathway component HofQ